MGFEIFDARVIRIAGAKVQIDSGHQMRQIGKGNRVSSMVGERDREALGCQGCSLRINKIREIMAEHVVIVNERDHVGWAGIKEAYRIKACFIIL